MRLEQLVEQVGRERGASPVTTSTSPSKPSRLARAQRTASPVPRGCSCTATSTPANASRASGEVTTTSGSAPSAARRLDHPVDQPAAEQRVQVLRRRRAHARAEAGGHDDRCEAGSGSRVRWLGRQDSNLGSRDQNPLPYHLATPHRYVACARTGVDGPAGKAGAASRRHRKRRLGTWLAELSPGRRTGTAVRPRRRSPRAAARASRG